jgi:hypothetical protein
MKESFDLQNIMQYLNILPTRRHRKVDRAFLQVDPTYHGRLVATINPSSILVNSEYCDPTLCQIPSSWPLNTALVSRHPLDRIAMNADRYHHSPHHHHNTILMHSQTSDNRPAERSSPCNPTDQSTDKPRMMISGPFARHNLGDDADANTRNPVT